MAETTKIQWTHHTFNPWRGCTKVAPGCANCYAAVDRSVSLHGIKWGPNGTRQIKAESGWKDPIKWNRAAVAAGERRRVFCASLADVFEGRETMPEAAWNAVETARRRLFTLIDATPNLDWLLLTKRPENIRQMWPSADVFDADSPHKAYWPNIWLGTSISDQSTANTGVSHLMKCRDLCPVLFLSGEPLLGPIDLGKSWELHCESEFPFLPSTWEGKLNECPNCEDGQCPTEDGYKCIVCKGDCFVDGIDWVIAGGESGPIARPCQINWIRNIVRQCQHSNARCFVKQVGAPPRFDRDETTMFVRDPKGGNPDEWPADLRVREFPHARAGV